MNITIHYLEHINKKKIVSLVIKIDVIKKGSISP